VVELRQLDHFVAVAEEASFTKGALRLHAAQSAASAAVARLERQLGQELFVRGSRPLRLTEGGHLLLDRARSIQRQTRDAVAELHELRDGLGGTVTIGTVLSLGTDVLPRALLAFHRRFPRVTIRVVLSAGPVDTHVDKVTEGSFDVALVPAPGPVPATVASWTVERIRLGLACPVDHPLAAANQVSYQELAGETFIDFPADWGNRIMVDSLFERERCTRVVAIEVTDVGAALTLVGGGLGLAFVPVEFLTSRADIAAVDLRQRPPSVPIAAVIRRQQSSPATWALYRLLIGSPHGEQDQQDGDVDPGTENGRDEETAAG